MKSWDGAQLGQLTPTDQRDIPGRRRKRGFLKLWLLSSQVTVMCDGAQHSGRWLNTCLPKESSE